MKKVSRLLPALLPLGCDRSAPIEEAESLAVDPELLTALREQCKTDRVLLGGPLS